VALDYKAAIVAAIWTAFRANTLVNSTFLSGNQWDERTNGPKRHRLAATAPLDRTNIAVEMVGGDEQSTRTPHFGLTGTVNATCDAIVPVTFVVRITMQFDKEKAGDQTPVEREVRKALHSNYPKIGSLSYIRDFTIREQRTPPSQAPQAQAKSVWDVTYNLRLHLSQLRD
jgi:hypothetical protein